jgi:hypothetical protein
VAKQHRKKREPPVQTGPIRNRINAGRPASPSRSGYTIGAAIDDSIDTARRIVETADATVMGAVERGVATAYTVIDEYMIRGQQAARRYQQGNPRSDDMSDGRQNGNGRQFDAWSSMPWDQMSAMMAPWMPMMRMWQDSMSAFTQGTPMADWMNALNPQAMMAMARGGRVRIGVQIASDTPASVVVELDPGAERMNLSADALKHATDRDAPSIAATSIECSEGIARVRVTVPTDQPAGSYRGRIVDDAGAVRGNLTVDLEPAESSSTNTRSTRAKKQA